VRSFSLLGPATCLAFSAFTIVPVVVQATTLPNPGGLPPGSQYHLVFVTDATTAATNPNQAYYDGIVQAEADADGLGATTWHALDQVVNGYPLVPPYTENAPVFNMSGQLVSSDPTTLLADGPLNPINTDGVDTFQNVPVWTGDSISSIGPMPPGTAGGRYSNFLGGDDFTTSALGDSLLTGLLAIEYSDYPSYSGDHLYAISNEITVPTPEPASITLLGSALLGLGLVNLRRRRAKG
jgi:hypothetical protein